MLRETSNRSNWDGEVVLFLDIGKDAARLLQLFPFHELKFEINLHWSKPSMFLLFAHYIGYVWGKGGNWTLHIVYYTK